MLANQTSSYLICELNHKHVGWTTNQERIWKRRKTVQKVTKLLNYIKVIPSVNRKIDVLQ